MTNPELSGSELKLTLRDGVCAGLVVLLIAGLIIDQFGWGVLAVVVLAVGMAS